MSGARRYGARASLFGDGAKGYRLQTYEIFELVNETTVATGIIEIATKEDHTSQFKSTFTRGEKTFETRAAAIADYEAAPA